MNSYYVGKIFQVLMLLVAIELSISETAFAYLDPGAGSYVYQVIVAAIIGGLFTIKMFWLKIKKFFFNLFCKKQRD